MVIPYPLQYKFQAALAQVSENRRYDENMTAYQKHWFCILLYSGNVNVWTSAVRDVLCFCYINLSVEFLRYTCETIEIN